MSTIGWIVVAAIVLPPIVVRRSTLAKVWIGELAAALFAFTIWRLFPGRDPFMPAIALGVAFLAILSVGVAAGRHVQWSAMRAALLATVVYALIVPTQIRTVIDGDEPFYLLITESIVRDRDLDLANQYASLDTSETRRRDLQPQFGDPVGPNGELYSRHELFLPLLMVPGYAIAGLLGALATIVLFGGLLVRSTIRMLEDEGIEDGVIRVLFPFFAFAPPVIFYATRIWPEVPGAFFFVEALRAVRQRRLVRALPALAGLVLLKLRFGLIGAILAAALVWERSAHIRERRSRWLSTIPLILFVPILLVWAVTGNPLNVHSWEELLPSPARAYFNGAFGLLLDGASGLAFQAPFYLLGIFAATRWKLMPATFRLGALAAAPYLISLVPRAEWYGGWSPPLRYVVVFMPLLALAAATLVQTMLRARRETSMPPSIAAFLAPVSFWTIGITIHGLAYPWRLFHIANGENAVGEWLSVRYAADFSRLFPSYIRRNDAAVAGAIAIVVAILLFRRIRLAPQLVAPLLALLLACGYVVAQQPAARVEIEDAHVYKYGGTLYPGLYQVQRFFYRSGWELRQGDSLVFLAQKGRALLEYASATPVTLEIDGVLHHLPATANDHWAAAIELGRSGRITIRVVEGHVNIDRLWNE